MQQTDSSNFEQQSQSTETDAPVTSSQSLFNVLQVIIRYRKCILGITGTTTLLMVIFTLTMPNIYTARTRILPPQQGGGLLSTAMMQGALAAAVGGDLAGIGESKNAKLYAEMLKTEGLRDAIIDRFSLQQLYRKKFRDDVYRTLQNNVVVQSGKEGIITISVDDTDPKRAAEMANAFVDELKKLTMQMSMAGAYNNKSFLEERITKARQDLTQAENSIKAFQSRYKTLDASQQATISASAIAQLAAQLTSQEVQLGVVRRTYAESSQEVKALERSIGILKSRIAAMQSKGGSTLPGFEQIPERGQEYLHLMRTFKTAEAVHDMLVRQHEISRLNAENDISTIQVIQKAVAPDRKGKPHRFKIVVITLFAAALASILLAFALEHLGRMSDEEKHRWKSLLGRS